jgi:hypothetical protein
MLTITQPAIDVTYVPFFERMSVALANRKDLLILYFAVNQRKKCGNTKFNS